MLPPRGAVAVTVEDVEVPKEDARFELTEQLRESIGVVAEGEEGEEEVRSKGTVPGTKSGRYICRT